MMLSDGKKQQKSMHRKLLGAWGEKVAGEYLQKKGYLILARNIKIGRGELDILGWKDNVLIVVEVKTKVSNFFGEPAEMVDKRKMQQLEKLALRLVTNKKLAERINVDSGEINWQIDVIAVYGNGRRVFDIIHYENIMIWE